MDAAARAAARAVLARGDAADLVELVLANPELLTALPPPRDDPFVAAKRAERREKRAAAALAARTATARVGARVLESDKKKKNAENEIEAASRWLGKRARPDGRVLEGTWRMGKRVAATSGDADGSVLEYGTRALSDGSIVEGAWRNGKWQGRCTRVHPGKYRFECEFRDCQAEGRGVLAVGIPPALALRPASLCHPDAAGPAAGGKARAAI